MREYQIDEFLSPKGSIKSSPHSQLFQNPKGDYYNNVIMQFKHLLCKLCYYSSFICMTSSKLLTTSAFLAYKVDPLLFTGRNIHLRLISSML